MSEAKLRLLGFFRSQSRSERRVENVNPKGPHSIYRQHSKSYNPAEVPAKHDAESMEQSPALSIPDENFLDQWRNSDSIAFPEWPPRGLNVEDILSEQQAWELIVQGAPRYKGFCFSIPYASEDYFALYATCEGVEGDDDSSGFYSPAFAAMTFNLYGSGIPSGPCDSLEQPSLTFCYGERAGTITLNRWVGLSAKLMPTVHLRDPGIKPRNVDFSTIVDRLIYLESGLEEDSEDHLYKSLYKNFLRDPDRFFNPHKAMEKQIADLITVLSGPQWIDFSDSRNQVVAKFFVGISLAKGGQYKHFLHQLLLSTELDLRIHSKSHGDSPKRKLLSQLPPRLVWNLALSRKWRECIKIEKIKKKDGSEKLKLHLRNKNRQIKALRKFVRAMKWPNLTEVDEVLKSRDRKGKAIQDFSSDTMSYISGVILPGGTLPFLLMNSLVDCDEDGSTGHLDALSHTYPQCGFQYRSTTYWSSACIVGKVLAPSCREIAGWVGPAISTSDLARVQIARVRQRRPRQHISSKEVQSMSARSSPLGPPAPHNVYPVIEYQLAIPDLGDVVDTIRIEKLAFVAISDDHASHEQSGPKLYDACIQFAVDGRSWPLRLSFDVSYISAYPCVDGPHILFCEYIYKVISIDKILAIRDWGRLNASKNDSMKQNKHDFEGVLVVKAFGVPDNEILGRAWSSHWGLGAIIANIDKTCMACAIREAYAACLNVVMLVGGL